jgi:glycerate kinase
MSRLKGSTSGGRYSGKPFVGSCSKLGVVSLRRRGFLGMVKVWFDRAPVIGRRLLWSLCFSALRRNPLLTTTFGVGQLIVAALDVGAENILLGCSDSGTCDGGVNMAQALEARFHNLDRSVVPIASGGKALAELSDVGLAGLHPRLSVVAIDAAVNWHNVLCGEKALLAFLVHKKVPHCLKSTSSPTQWTASGLS